MFEFERTVSKKSLWEAWQTIRSKSRKFSCGIDQIDIGVYEDREYDNINLLHYSLISGAYRPYREKSFTSRQKRTIYISCLEDKIVQTAVAKVLSELITFHPCVHSFIKGRSIFTAYFELKKHLPNIEEFYKTDIAKFYESIPKQTLIKKIEQLTGDKKFIDLIDKILKNHPRGISTGSSLSPVLSNIYLTDFDQTMSNNSVFYLRYVDDMLIAPNNGMEDLIRRTGEELEQRSLRVNQEKSKIVNATEGFRYLGFEIKKHKTMDELICNGNFAQAEISLNSLEPDSKDPAYFGDDFENKGQQEEQVEEQRREEDNNITADTGDDCGSDEEIPAHILSIQNNCHIIDHLVNKAKHERFLSYPEKRVLLYIYKCLGDDGAKYLHTILEHCMDYNYHTTQGYIDRCKIQQPMGCKKISELFEDCCDKSGCNCNFKNEKLYPTPLIHALREKRDCFILSEASKNIGHFKKLPPKQDIHETLSKTLTLNKQIHELKIQQKICRQRLEGLFEKNGYMEIETPQGLLIKNDEGLFIKL